MTAHSSAALIDPERQFVGCLMQLPHTPARRLLAGIRATDFAGPMSAHVLKLAIEVIDNDRPPAPVTLYAHAVATGQCPGEHRQHRLSGWLIDTYRDASPPAVADHLKTVLLEAAWRRALTTHARRLLQVADTSTPDRLREFANDTTAVDELWSRYETALAVPSRLEVAA